MGDIMEMFNRKPNSSESKQEKLDRIKDQIQNGQFQIDIEKIADKILESGVLDE